MTPVLFFSTRDISFPLWHNGNTSFGDYRLRQYQGDCFQTKATTRKATKAETKPKGFHQELPQPAKPRSHPALHIQSFRQSKRWSNDQQTNADNKTGQQPWLWSSDLGWIFIGLFCQTVLKHQPIHLSSVCAARTSFATFSIRLAPCINCSRSRSTYSPSNLKLQPLFLWKSIVNPIKQLAIFLAPAPILFFPPYHSPSPLRPSLLPPSFRVERP
jgi:hypothetical protein